MSTLDINTLDATMPSLCIPRVFSNITRDRVFDTIKELNIGYINRIDMIRKTNEKGESFQRVFIHLRWFRNDVADKARKRLIDGKDIKIVYDDPWFWKVSANRAVNHHQYNNAYAQSRPNRSKASIQFDSMEDDDNHESSDMQAIKHRRQMNSRNKGRGRNYPQKKNQSLDNHDIASANIRQDLTIKIPGVDCEADLHTPCTPPYSPPRVDKEMSDVDVTIGPYGDKEEGEV